MKLVPLVVPVLGLALLWQTRGQDAATEERLNKLTGQIEDLLAAERALAKRIDELGKELSDLRDELAKPNPVYVSQEDWKHLTESVQEIDQKRLQDYEKIRSELMDLSKTLSAPPVSPETIVTNAPTPGTNNLSITPLENGGFEYVVQPNDSLSKIAQTFRREKNLKITVSEILKANPSLVPDRIRPGRKIIIPATAP
jgi:LysM repeat protein